MAFKVVRADGVGAVGVGDARAQIAKLFAEGFAQWLVFFSKDEAVIERAFAHMFLLDQFYAAVDGDKVAGVVACMASDSGCVKLCGKELRRHLGFYKGTLAKLFLSRSFEAPYPDPKPNVGLVAFVGTAKEYRGRGVATQIIQHFIDTSKFDTFVITEVADTNVAAMNLYTKLGFIEYSRRPVKPRLAGRVGINNFLGLRFTSRPQ